MSTDQCIHLYLYLATIHRSNNESNIYIHKQYEIYHFMLKGMQRVTKSLLKKRSDLKTIAIHAPRII